MGNGAALLKTRYIGGKKLRKYFLEDVLVTIQNYMGIFAMGEETAFTIFRAFAVCDTRDRGLVSNSELFRYIGCKPNKFTERIFYSEPFMDDDGFKQSGELTDLICVFPPLITAVLVLPQFMLARTSLQEVLPVALELLHVELSWIGWLPVRDIRRRCGR